MPEITYLGQNILEAQSHHKTSLAHASRSQKDLEAKRALVGSSKRVHCTVAIF